MAVNVIPDTLARHVNASLHPESQIWHLTSVSNAQEGPFVAAKALVSVAGKNKGHSQTFDTKSNLFQLPM